MPDAKIAKNTGTSPEIIAGTSLIGVPIMLTAVRCTLQYILVPFVLPLIGLGSALSTKVNVAAGLLGLAVIAYNLTRLWNTNWRRRYLLLSLVVVPFILLSLYFDLITG